MIKNHKYSHLVKYAPIVDAIDKHTLFTANGKVYKRTFFILTKVDSLEGRVKNLPYEVACMQYVRSVSILDNRGLNLKQTLCVLGQITNLEDLLLASCEITSLPKEMGLFKNLRMLGLDHNDIRQLPEEIKMCKNLTSLYLNGNSNLNIEKIFDAIQDLPIEYLDISDCNLKYLPSNIGKMKKLQKLIIDGNFIKDLPCELSNITSDGHNLIITTGEKNRKVNLLKPCLDIPHIVLD